jgi:hypothetical protein
MPATEIDILATYLCCAEKFHYIKSVIETKTSMASTTRLRDQLRSRTAMNRLHFSLEKAFDNHLQKLKQEKDVKNETSDTQDKL